MKIQFKKFKDVDLTKVFPVISEEEYKLLAGQFLIIPDSEWDKIQKAGKLTVKPFEISADLIEVVSGQQDDPALKRIATEVNKHSVYMDDMVEVLSRGVKLGKNVLLFGRGGHNKSEGTMQILDLMRKEGLVHSEPFVQALGDGLTEETLFGGIDVKKFKDTGEIEYLVKNSWMEHEVVIFEEVFDAPPQVLLSLKDIMASGKFRKGKQQHKIKTKLIIGLTNRSKEEFSEDDALEALVQRFPLTLKVEWPSYDKKDWNLLFRKVFDADFNADNNYKLAELSEILSQNNMAQETFVSPRTAVHAAQLYADGGDLKFISDISPNVLEQFYKANKDNEQNEADNNMLKIVDEYIKSNSLGEIDTNARLLALLSGEYEGRTGNKLDVVKDEEAQKIKLSKLEFAVSLMKIHNWSKKNIQRSTQKIQELQELIVQNTSK